MYVLVPMVVSTGRPEGKRTVHVQCTEETKFYCGVVPRKRGLVHSQGATVSRCIIFLAGVVQTLHNNSAV